MRWRGRRKSVNVEDRRGSRAIRRGVPTIGCGGIVLVVLFSVLTGNSPLALLEMLGGGAVSTQGGGTPLPAPGPSSGAQDELSEFASVVLADTETTWNQIFTRYGERYQEPRLVLFSGAVSSACGYNTSAVGPFYCPADYKVYLDLSFFNEMSRRLGAPGDFAQAYVIAHEVGHHVQNLLRISDRVQAMRQRSSRRDANALSVLLELQADCLAGVWAHQAHRNRQLLEPGDVEEGLRAASAIGDDAMQRRATGTVRPESWTHGSSEQRVQWLRRGLETGDPDQCDTFQGRLR